MVFEWWPQSVVISERSRGEGVSEFGEIVLRQSDVGGEGWKYKLSAVGWI